MSKEHYETGAIPICEQKRYDCNRCMAGHCILLTDTNFKRKCPFYTPKTEEEKDGRS